ncbi:biopolymer transporter Tol [Nocardioides perillae]|uniref:Biopolymer transporter Tol n=1 Tax=Nocardioides perillae TaxID=1119534 RepID=A0A7Y9RV92_9ACTN|nr:biopolymer transporter Tol [Nocardioides perillae]NYG55996.1 hypothetical protein [Nocardioides perillae]
MAREVHPTDDGHWLVVDGRRWRRQDPAIPEEEAARLRSHLGRGRSATGAARRAGDAEAEAAARQRTGLAKHGLGERGTPWWEQSDAERRRRWTEALARLDALDGPGDVAGETRD